MRNKPRHRPETPMDGLGQGSDDSSDSIRPRQSVPWQARGLGDPRDSAKKKHAEGGTKSAARGSKSLYMGHASPRGGQPIAVYGDAAGRGGQGVDAGADGGVGEAAGSGGGKGARDGRSPLTRDATASAFSAVLTNGYENIASLHRILPRVGLGGGGGPGSRQHGILMVKCSIR